MDWFVLGIEPTKDKKAITAAYRRMLSRTNPEDKPEEFKALRASYEEALALADQAEAPRDESPVGLWMEKIRAVYQDYPARIDPARWAQLLREDVCTALDTRPAAEEALLKFLMENYSLPQKVWQELDKVFDLVQRAQELSEVYPRDFIEQAVVKGVRLEPVLAYELFIPGENGADCDTYRRLYFQGMQTVPAELAPVLEQMDALSERNPGGEILRCRYLLATDREEEAHSRLKALAEEYPDAPNLALPWAEVCLETDDVAQAKAIVEHILELEAEHSFAKSLLAECLAKQGSYQEAKEMVYELMHSASGDYMTMDRLSKQVQEWNEALILQQQKRYAEAPEDTDNAIELAWSYFQNERSEEALELARAIDEEAADPFAYHNMMGKLLHNTEQYEEALTHFRIVEQIVRGLQPDGTEKTEKRIRRLPEMLQIQGSCLMQLQRGQEAREKLEEALALAPEDPEILTVMGKILFHSGEYGQAAEVLERLAKLRPEAWFADTLLSLCYYRMRRDRDAYDSVQRALASQRNDLSLYILKMQILIRNGVWDEVRATLDFLKENGAPEDIHTDFIKAQLVHLEKKDEKKALEQYRELVRRLDKEEMPLWAGELAFRLAVLTGKNLELHREENRNKLLRIVDKGLSYDPNNEDLLDYKAWVLKRTGQREKAIAMYQALEAKNPGSPVALRGLAQLYYDNLDLYAREALECYERLLQTQRTAVYYFYAATCKRHLGDYAGAMQYYRAELELDAEDVDGYNGLAFVFDARGENARALEMLDEAIGIMENYGQQYMWLFEHKVQALRRMGQYERALETVDYTMQHYGYGEGFRLKFEICCQFGLWDRAKQVLDAWKKKDAKDPDLLNSIGRLYLLTGKMFRAVMAMGIAKHKMSPDRVEDFRLQLADLECNAARKVQIWSRRVKMDPQGEYELTNLAQAYWHAGKKEAAQGAAEKALKVLDDILAHNTTSEALYRSRRCLVLALLGREAEARAELEATRKLPLCEHCSYGVCKDADIYEAAIEEILGDPEKALALYREGKEKWPDDLDFASGEARLGKGK